MFSKFDPNIVPSSSVHPNNVSTESGISIDVNESVDAKHPLPSVTKLGGKITEFSFLQLEKTELLRVKRLSQLLISTRSSDDVANVKEPIFETLLDDSNVSDVMLLRQSLKEPSLADLVPPRISSTLRRMTTSPESFFGALTRTLNKLDSYSMPVFGSKLFFDIN